MAAFGRRCVGQRFTVYILAIRIRCYCCRVQGGYRPIRPLGSRCTTSFDEGPRHITVYFPAGTETGSTNDSYRELRVLRGGIQFSDVNHRHCQEVKRAPFHHKVAPESARYSSCCCYAKGACVDRGLSLQANQVSSIKSTLLQDELDVNWRKPMWVEKYRDRVSCKKKHRRTSRNYKVYM